MILYYIARLPCVGGVSDNVIFMGGVVCIKKHLLFLYDGDCAFLSSFLCVDSTPLNDADHAVSLIIWHTDKAMIQRWGG